MTEQLQPGPKPGAAAIGLLVLIGGQSLILFNAGVRLPAVLPENIGTFTSVDTLFRVVLSVAGFLFLISEGLLIRSCLELRARDGRTAVPTHRDHPLRLTWTLIPGAILFGLVILQTASWGEINAMGSLPDEEEAVVVQVFARQYEWHFRHPGEDGVFGTADDVTRNGELHVPVDRDIILAMRTRDVLHSFWLENVRIQQDLLPGQTVPAWFHATRTGRFEIACAELCGLGHTVMRAVLVVESEEEYQAWQRGQRERFGEHDPQEDAMWKFWPEGPGR